MLLEHFFPFCGRSIAKYRELELISDDLCDFEIPDRAAFVRKKKEIGENVIKNFLFPAAEPGTRACKE
ncbi:hypothetical protein ID47_03180 [Candidatus Paracaedibacter acanthamoebae]|uniref:Uncharacterized protein n=1 Tax=Candidatus Odyssella acanthamoebae TaxID=91604 RepID=A0A077AWF0_9PROT|nr:hypothetical protein ID47_03180 [Candidatus Paracaedibacter acanthamoebae]